MWFTSGTQGLYKSKLFSKINIFYFSEYPDHLKPDVYVKYESAYLNIVVYIVGILSTFLLLGTFVL